MHGAMNANVRVRQCHALMEIVHKMGTESPYAASGGGMEGKRWWCRQEVRRVPVQELQEEVCRPAGGAGGCRKAGDRVRGHVATVSCLLVW